MLVNIGYTNEKPVGFSGDDAGRMLQELFAGQYTAEEFAEAYEQAWAGRNEYRRRIKETGEVPLRQLRVPFL